MRCPYCGADDSKVIDSRPTEDGEKIRRRRECLSCKKRFTTYEIVETVPLMVIKKDRSREVFDRQKLLNGMLRACEKRPVSYEQLDAAVSRIEQVLLNSYDREVTSVYIGDLAMEQLKKMDDVAYAATRCMNLPAFTANTRKKRSFRKKKAKFLHRTLSAMPSFSRWQPK